MTLPSAVGGATTREVGFFQLGAAELADWFVRVGDVWWSSWVSSARPAGIRSLDDALALLTPPGPVTLRLWVPIGGWTALLTNGPGGTDVGLLPMNVAKELGCRTIRAVNVEDGEIWPARILEVFGPDGDPDFSIERGIVAMNDGGRWIFESGGTPYPFEDQSAYTRRRKASRFTSEMLYDYLRGLGVPIDAHPDWPGAILVEAVDTGVMPPEPPGWR